MERKIIRGEWAQQAEYERVALSEQARYHEAQYHEQAQYGEALRYEQAQCGEVQRYEQARHVGAKSDVYDHLEVKCGYSQAVRAQQLGVQLFRGDGQIIPHEPCDSQGIPEVDQYIRHFRDHDNVDMSEQVRDDDNVTKRGETYRHNADDHVRLPHRAL